MFFVASSVVILCVATAEFLQKPPKSIEKASFVGREQAHVRKKKDKVKTHDPAHLAGTAIANHSKQPPKIVPQHRVKDRKVQSSLHQSSLSSHKDEKVEPPLHESGLSSHKEASLKEQEDGLTEITVPASQLDSLGQEVSPADPMQLRNGNASLLATRDQTAVHNKVLSRDPDEYMTNLKSGIDKLEEMGFLSDDGPPEFENQWKEVSKTGNKALSHSKEYKKAKQELLSASDTMGSRVEELRTNAVASVMATKNEMAKEMEFYKQVELPPESEGEGRWWLEGKSEALNRPDADEVNDKLEKGSSSGSSSSSSK